MKPAHLTTIWAVLSVFLVAYAVGVVAYTQGGAASTVKIPIIDLPLVIAGRGPAAVAGLIVCTVTLILSATVGWAYARQSKPFDKWYSRIPVVGLKDMVPGDVMSRFYQGLVLFVFLVPPIYAIVHFWRIMLGSRVVTTDPTPKPTAGVWDWSALTSLNDPARICALTTDDCKPSSTYFPGLEPVVLIVLCLIAAFVVGGQLLAIFRRPR